MIEQILKERGNRYGNFGDHAQITQELKDAMREGASWNQCSDDIKEALDMIAHKIGRIVNGDPYYDDSWIDIIGYSQLVLDDLKEDEEETEYIHEQEQEDEQEEDDFITDIDKVLEQAQEILQEILGGNFNKNNESEDYKESLNISEKLQLIDINGIKVFISQDELEKLEALKETKDHDDQTYMNFDKINDHEMTYEEFLKKYQ